MAGTSFHDLPLEIRQMVYLLVLDETLPLLITSLSRKIKIRSRTKGNAALFLVSRVVYADLAYLHYSRNTFIVGNGLSNSTTEANIHGFTSFLSRVPRHHINCITRLKVMVYSRRIAPWVWGYDCCTYTDLQLAAFQKLAIMITDRFLGAQKIGLCFRIESEENKLNGSKTKYNRGNSPAACQRSLFKSIIMLLQHRGLRKVFLDIEECPGAPDNLSLRPSSSMSKLIKNTVIQAIEEQEKWLDIADSEAGEHSPWRLTEAPADRTIGLMVRE